MSKKIKRGWAFTRVSTAEQANTQHGSLEQQRHMIDRWAKQQTEQTGVLYQIDKYFEEDESGRGKNLHRRPSMLQLENALRSGTIDFFAVEKIDRLSRDQSFNLKILKLALERGIEMHEYESGLVDFRDRGKRLGFNIKNMLSEEYVLDLEEKITKKQREAMVNNGKDSSSKPVLGLDKHPLKRCFYKINVEEQGQVVAVFGRFLETGSLKATVEFCNEKGYRTKQNMTKEKTSRDGEIIPPRLVGGDPFDERTLRRLLSSHKLRGFSYFIDKWNQFPDLQDESGLVRWEYGHYRDEGPVVPLELWNAVQELLEKNKQTNNREKSEANVYLLSGVLFKPNGAKLIGASAKSGAIRYYEDRDSGGEYRINKDEIEKAVCARAKSFLKDSGLLELVLGSGVGQRDDRVTSIRSELSKTSVKIESLTKAKETISEKIRSEALVGGADLIAVAKLLGAEAEKIEMELGKLTTQQSQLQTELRVLTEDYKEQKVAELLEKALKDFDRRCDLEKKQIIQAIIPKIVVHKDKLELHFNFLGKKAEGRIPGGQKFDSSKNGSDGGTNKPDSQQVPYGIHWIFAIAIYWRQGEIRRCFGIKPIKRQIIIFILAFIWLFLIATWLYLALLSM